jgi:hypothetical protein
MNEMEKALLVTAKVVPSSLIIYNLMVEALLSSETSVQTRAIRRHIPEDGIPHNPRHESFRNYTVSCIFIQRNISALFVLAAVIYSYYVLRLPSSFHFICLFFISCFFCRY